MNCPSQDGSRESGPLLAIEVWSPAPMDRGEARPSISICRDSAEACRREEIAAVASELWAGAELRVSAGAPGQESRSGWRVWRSRNVFRISSSLRAARRVVPGLTTVVALGNVEGVVPRLESNLSIVFCPALQQRATLSFGPCCRTPQLVWVRVRKDVKSPVAPFVVSTVPAAGRGVTIIGVPRCAPAPTSNPQVTGRLAGRGWGSATFLSIIQTRVGHMAAQGCERGSVFVPDRLPASRASGRVWLCRKDGAGFPRSCSRELRSSSRAAL